MTDPAPFFSVIIPTFNRASLLAETLTSVFAQRLTSYEVIVADDGSTDGTASLLASRANQLVAVHQVQRGPGAARNLGSRHAAGRYLAFLDSDDLWFPWTLEVYARVIEECGHPAFVAGKPARFTRVEDLDPARPASPRTVRFADYLASGDEWRWWGASSFVVRTDAFAACGGFTDLAINGEDADLALKLGTAPGFVQVLEPHTFGYREHPSSLVSRFERTWEGAWHAVASERAGRYPGGESRAAERRRVLGRHLRPVMIQMIEEGHTAEALRMYRTTFGWHVSEGRWRFLAGLPAMALGFRRQAAA